MPERKFKPGDKVRWQVFHGGVWVDRRLVVIEYKTRSYVLCDDNGESIIAHEPDLELEGKLPRSLTVYLDPGDAPQELITEFYLALSALYQANGGSGLKLVKDKRRILKAEEVG